MTNKTGNHFKDNHYVVIREAIKPEVADFISKYFFNKRALVDFLMQDKYLSPFDQTWGYWTDPQAPEAYSHYADIAMETLLLHVKPVMEYITELQLVPCYSYARIYNKGQTLTRHRDRPECEISATMNLGGDLWPIFIDPTGQQGQQGIEVSLNPGDMLIYKGNILEHWREEFQGNECCQVFLHYNDRNGPFKDQNLYDHRPMLGLPSDYKND